MLAIVAMWYAGQLFLEAARLAEALCPLRFGVEWTARVICDDDDRSPLSRRW
jgi:hypothetical protein